MSTASKIVIGKIVIDWGTSSMRAVLVDAGGTILDRKASAMGIQFVENAAFEAALIDAVGDWYEAHGPLDTLLSGMITSRNGWHEVPYVPCPASAAQLALGTVQHRLANGASLTFFTGLNDPGQTPFPDVMRGEETQIVGYGLDAPRSFVLPGTHSKWVRVAEGAIQSFKTLATGEVYALMTSHGFLTAEAKGVDDKFDAGAFDKGVETALGHDAALLGDLFSVRTGLLANQLTPQEQPDYLSGLLIGHEFVAAKRGGFREDGAALTLIGAPALCMRYGRVAEHLGHSLLPSLDDAAFIGAQKLYEALKP